MTCPPDPPVAIKIFFSTYSKILISFSSLIPVFLKTSLET